MIFHADQFADITWHCIAIFSRNITNRQSISRYVCNKSNRPQVIYAYDDEQFQSPSKPFDLNYFIRLRIEEIIFLFNLLSLEPSHRLQIHLIYNKKFSFSKKNDEIPSGTDREVKLMVQKLDSRQHQYIKQKQEKKNMSKILK